MRADQSPSEEARVSSDRLEQDRASDASITAIHQQLLREKPEPSEGFSPVPIALLFIFAALIFTSGIYIAKYSGGFDPLVFNERAGDGGESETAPQVVDPMVLGARFYSTVCSACHQPNGAGIPIAFPPLAGSDWVLGNEQRIIRVVLHGLQGPIVVNGQPFVGVMQAHGPGSTIRLNAERVAAVLTYIRNSWGNEAPPVTQENVQEVIDATSARPAMQAWTAEELAQFE